VEVMTGAPRTGTQNGAAVQAIAWKLRDLVRDLLREAIQQMDLPAGLLRYGLDSNHKGTLCVIMPLKKGVNLGFPRGIELPAPAGLLVGTGKRARHIRISNIHEVNWPAVLDLLQAVQERLLGSRGSRGRR
jgi:aryl carrier-like protein